MIIGVDFDNTIVDYDELMHSIAMDRGLVGATMGRNKKQIRDTIRGLPDGEVEWQRLQIEAYGLRMSEAVPTEGVKAFFLACKQRDVPVRIISHKTKHPNLGESQINLRAAALAWLEQQDFFARDGLGIARAHVYFESSRAEKVARIAQLGVTHFVDDLEETFGEPDFPASVEKILYSTEPAVRGGGVKQLESWALIREYLLPATQPAQAAGQALP